MSEDENPIQDDKPASVDSPAENEKPPRKRAARKTARKSAKKRAEKSDDAPQSDGKPKSEKGSDKSRDDTFDPGDEVSFSFDPNDVSEPGGDEGKGGNQKANESADRENKAQDNNQQGGRNQNQNQNQNRKQKFQKGNFKKKGGRHNHQHQQKKQAKKRPQKKKARKKAVDSIALPPIGSLLEDETVKSIKDLKFLAEEGSGGGEPIKLTDFYQLPLLEFVAAVEAIGVTFDTAPNKRMLLDLLIKYGVEHKRQILDTGLLWVTDDDGAFIVHEHNNYVPHPQDFYVPDCFIKQYGLKSGHMVEVQVLPQEGEGCGYVVDLISASGMAPEEIQHITPFEDLIPYYPTERILLETPVEDLKNQDVSMRVVDALTPIGFGQRGLIVAPPRTGKTVILQGLANSLAANNPDADLIVLLIDERPEEVTDFRRMVQGEVIASTFDEAADNHVHVAEMVIEKARRMVEIGRNVIILLDSITRLARGYNTMMPNSGKILSGGVEAGALQKPKRFFGSARNIEGGGSLTIMGTALVETGSKMDEVVFEEFKGTGNMELHLDRALSDKRIFPAINLEKSGTRKEELLYHKDELQRIYSLRRAMKGVPSTEAMEMLITRMKKTSTNIEFLMQVNR